MRKSGEQKWVVTKEKIVVTCDKKWAIANNNGGENVQFEEIKREKLTVKIATNVPN